jgi:hypothetical protein
VSGRDEQVVLIRGRDGVIRAMNRATGTVEAEYRVSVADEHDDRLKGWSLVFAWLGCAAAGWLLIYLGAHMLAAYLRSLIA